MSNTPPNENELTSPGPGIRKWIRELFDVRHEIDYKATAESVRKDVVFKGFNIWILILSIFICSIGLNLNSTAVVIGAMLISPLMGPITGVEFAIGTFDRELLIKAIKNLLIAMSISILTSFIFFKIAPISLNQSELLSRTKPGVMDLLVATFGGFAGILAGSRSIKTNVIPGVAIATALMPPLCTAGFGLATGNYAYFFGAFYLFFINSVFISLSALIVIRYLHFPIASYVDLSTRRKVRNFIIIFSILVSVPSIYLYSRALKRSVFEFRAQKFIAEVINSSDRQADHIQLYYTDSTRQIHAWVYGREILSQEKDSLQSILPQHGLKKSTLVIRNMGNYEAYKALFEQKDQELFRSGQETKSMESELVRVRSSLDLYHENLILPERFRVDQTALNREVRVLFPHVTGVNYLLPVQTDTMASCIPVFQPIWNEGRLDVEEEERLTAWLKARMHDQFDSIVVVHSK